ncbi:MAG: AAA family ATPase [Armatimonadetes bacterium]|nr:AAA family ATPase [Armatimonadota bacterium]
MRLTLELVTCAGGTVLIEEPEVHQHYHTMHLTAKVIWAAIKRNIQVILTTHSLEFIDALLEARPDDADINALSLVRTTLRDGALIASRYTGDSVRFARTEVAEDLR